MKKYIKQIILVLGFFVIIYPLKAQKDTVNPEIKAFLKSILINPENILNLKTAYKEYYNDSIFSHYINDSISLNKLYNYVKNILKNFDTNNLSFSVKMIPNNLKKVIYNKKVDSLTKYYSFTCHINNYRGIQAVFIIKNEKFYLVLVSKSIIQQPGDHIVIEVEE